MIDTALLRIDLEIGGTRRVSFVPSILEGQFSFSQLELPSVAKNQYNERRIVVLRDVVLGIGTVEPSQLSTADRTSL